jgi:hypothetical protein
MDWLVSDSPLTHETPAAYLTNKYTPETAEARSEVLAEALPTGPVQQGLGL